MGRRNQPTPDQQRAAMEQALLAGAQLMVDMWPTYLAGLEGMVAQTVERGWTEEQARALVAGALTGSGDQSDEDEGGQS